MLRFLPTTLLLLLLCSCASVPSPIETRLPPARHALASAYAAGAPDLAGEDYRRAKAKLEEGTRLAREGEHEKADLVLRQAIFFALKARRNSLDARQAEIVRQQSEGEDSGLASPLVKGEFRAQPGDSEAGPGRTKKPGSCVSRQRGLQSPADTAAAAEAVPEPEPAPAPELVPAPEPTAEPEPSLPVEYVVKDGETLWSIAARRDIYRDALLWPLIYKANRDQIKDPRQIFPQQVLTIPRGVSEEEIEEAREEARRSEIFPVEVLMRHLVDDKK